MFLGNYESHLYSSICLKPLNKTINLLMPLDKSINSRSGFALPQGGQCSHLPCSVFVPHLFSEGTGHKVLRLTVGPAPEWGRAHNRSMTVYTQYPASWSFSQLLATVPSSYEASPFFSAAEGLACMTVPGETVGRNVIRVMITTGAMETALTKEGEQFTCSYNPPTPTCLYLVVK